MFLTTEELKTHLRAEAVNLVSRGDDAVVTASIDGAVMEAKGYLSAYDTGVVFSATGNERHALLLILVKDIAVYHFLNMANPGIVSEQRQKRYERAVAWLRDVQKGNFVPDFPVARGETGEPAGLKVRFGGNKKRQQHF